MKRFPMAVFFDCDGTLFDTEPLKAKSWGRAMVMLLGARGLTTPPGMQEEQIAAMYQAGGTTEEVADDILRQCRSAFPSVTNWPSAAELIRERKDAKKAILQEASDMMIAPVWKLAVAAKSNGYPVGLVTTTDQQSVEEYFAASTIRGLKSEPITKPQEFFSVVVCGKKKGEGIKEAIRLVFGKSSFAEVPAEEVGNFVIVEDSLEGTREAKSVGVRVITVPNDFTRAAFPDLLLSQEAVGKLALAEVIKLLT